MTVARNERQSLQTRKIVVGAIGTDNEVRDVGNKTRLDFVRTLASGPWEPHDVEDDDVEAIYEQIKPWAAEKIIEVLRTLRAPTVDECVALIEAAHENGGIACLQDVCVFCQAMLHTYERSHCLPCAGCCRSWYH